MAKTKKPSVKVQDMKAKGNPKGGGKVKISDINFTHVVDKASPVLARSSTSSTVKLTDAALKIK